MELCVELCVELGWGCDKSVVGNILVQQPQNSIFPADSAGFNFASPQIKQEKAVKPYNSIVYMSNKVKVIVYPNDKIVMLWGEIIGICSVKHS